MTVVQGFELGRGGVGVVVGDLAVEAAVVEPVDVGHGRELDVVEASPWSLPVDEFPLVEPVERLRERVVVAAVRLLGAELAKRGEGGASFAAPMAALLDAMRPVAGVKLRDLGYGADGTLRFTAVAPRAEDINAVLIALQNNGWKVTVPPALAPDPTGATVAAISVRAP